MFRPVELPLWLLILLVLFAAVTFLSHFLFPSVRWFLRRRMERAVAELNKRLKRPVEPFKLARRFDTIQRLTYDRAVLDAVSDHAAETGVPEDVALQRARAYAREIVPSFAATIYFGPAIRLARWLAEKLYTVRVDHRSAQVLDRLDPEATVIYVMNHRSNMDYVLITYLVAEKSALSYAVGEWARVWPLSTLIRAMGAYFIRRRSRDALYRRVLARYVQIATGAGVTQAVFPEGRLSLDGRMSEPKLGLLSYVLAGFDRAAGRDVVFVPVALSYDRVLEDRVLTEAAADGTGRFRPRIRAAFGFALRYLWCRVRGRAGRFGVAGVRFGAPVSLSGFLAQSDDHGVDDLAADLAGRVRRAMPVLPVPLVAWIVTQASEPVSRDDLTHRAQTLLNRAEAPLMGRDAGALVTAGLAALLERGVLRDTAQGVVVNPDEAALAAYYANAVTTRFPGISAAELAFET